MIQARRAKKAFFTATFCRAKNDPQVTKIQLCMGFFWVVDREYQIAGTINFFWRFSPPKLREIFVQRLCPLSQSIGCGRISRQGSLGVRESRDRRDKISAEKTPLRPYFFKCCSYRNLRAESQISESESVCFFVLFLNTTLFKRLRSKMCVLNAQFFKIVFVQMFKNFKTVRLTYIPNAAYEVLRTPAGVYRHSSG